MIKHTMQVDFHTALYQANMLYGVDIPEDTFEELGLIAWNLIGNKISRVYKVTLPINKADLSVDLPCNADVIEAVTINGEDWNRYTNKHVNGDLNSNVIENQLESEQLDTSSLYISGHYVEYTQVGDKLYFKYDFGKVNILYKGIVLDNDGLPIINDKEALAIAAYCAYFSKYKEGLITNNANILEIANVIKQDWLLKCDQARVPENISQNEMDEVLEAKTTWNRKLHNYSYKPIV